MTENSSLDSYALLLQTARLAIEQFIQGDSLNVPALDDQLNQTRGVFVTLWESPKNFEVAWEERKASRQRSLKRRRMRHPCGYP